MTESDPQEILRGLIFGDNQPVSYRLLSRKSRLHINLSKEHLWQFYNNNKSSLHATYILSGVKPNTDQRAIILVPESDIDNAKSQFSDISSIHIYCIAPSNSNNISVLTNLDLQVQALDRLLTPANRATLGFIKNPLLEDGYVLRKKVAVEPPAPNIASKPVKSLSESSSTKVNVNTTGNPAFKSSSASSVKIPPTSTKTRTNPWKSGSASTASTATKAEVRPEQKQNQGPLQSAFKKALNKPRKESIEKVVVADTNDDEDIEMTEAQEESEDLRRQKAETREKNKLALESMFQDNSEDDEMEILDVANKNEKEGIEIETEEKEVVESKPDSGSQSLFVDEDSMKIDNADSQDASPPTVSPSTTSKKRKRVEKMVTKKDAKGYLVTKVESVWITDSEGEEEEKPSTVPKPNERKAPKKIPPRSKGKAAAGKGQSSLMSFFGKK